MNRQIGLIIAIIGVLLVILGLLWASGAMTWFGRLPGDIQRSGFSLSIPLASMLLVSLLLTLLVALLRRIL